jgi:hypothetical protein
MLVYFRETYSRGELDDTYLNQKDIIDYNLYLSTRTLIEDNEKFEMVLCYSDFSTDPYTKELMDSLGIYDH